MLNGEYSHKANEVIFFNGDSAGQWLSSGPWERKLHLPGASLVLRAEPKGLPLLHGGISRAASDPCSTLASGTNRCQGTRGTTWPAQSLHPRDCPPSNRGYPCESRGGALLFLELGRDIPGQESEVKEQSRMDTVIALQCPLSAVAGCIILTRLTLPALSAEWTLLSPGLPGHLTPPSLSGAPRGTLLTSGAHSFFVVGTVLFSVGC